MNRDDATIAAATNAVNSMSKSARPARVIGVLLIRDGDGQTGKKPIIVVNNNSPPNDVTYTGWATILIAKTKNNSAANATTATKIASRNARVMSAT